jgi:hypothetical protein
MARLAGWRLRSRLWVDSSRHSSGPSPPAAITLRPLLPNGTAGWLAAAAGFVSSIVGRAVTTTIITTLRDRCPEIVS